MDSRQASNGFITAISQIKFFIFDFIFPLEYIKHRQYLCYHPSSTLAIVLLSGSEVGL